MTLIDWIIVGVYLAALIGLSFWLSKGQENASDYYLGGRTLSWWSIGLSTMATQLSAVSFISAPAFVGLREGGGLQWLSYEFAVPLAMIFLITVVVPPLYRSGVISIYGYLEDRFGASTRLLLSLVFQFSRAFATGITVYTMALVLSTMVDLPIAATILIAGVAAVVYDFLGGMKAVVWSDVIQMGVLSVGIVVCTVWALDLVGGWSVFWQEVNTARLDAVLASDLGIGADSGGFGLLPMIVGGFFLYASYYGCDQSQAQRALSAKDLSQVKRVLAFNGFARFPLVLLYCGMGLVVGTFAAQDPAFLDMIEAERVDSMMPLFIVHYLPAGIVGLLVAAILSAAMSSLDSALNSLSAASLEDVVQRARSTPMDDATRLATSKALTVFWGAVCIVLAFAADDIAQTVIEAINKVGSLFYGPILATFTLAILTRRTHALGVNLGIAAGVGVNFLLWIFASDVVFWFWWNATGFVTTAVVGYAASHLLRDRSGTARSVLDRIETLPLVSRVNAALALYFVAILAFSASLVFLR